MRVMICSTSTYGVCEKRRQKTITGGLTMERQKSARVYWPMFTNTISHRTLLKIRQSRTLQENSWTPVEGVPKSIHLRDLAEGELLTRSMDLGLI